MPPQSDPTAGWIVGFAGFVRGNIMKLVLEMIGCWILFSCVVGPCLTWAFFYSERRARGERILERAHSGEGDRRVLEQRLARKSHYDEAATPSYRWATSAGLRPPS